eukprot:TRINITY_DN946_c0_g1_i2.p2 TRINITY_DN946_c0_g1~~TRINITY_DN946_c0_g1_i2.p2  ORF type:complete len:136 (+),score=60.76 TRINITY_DN946_c0_g1_i2:69-476(+)
MSNPQPILRLRKVKKHKNKFKRHHSERYDRVKEAWRKPRGIDSRVRRRFRGVRVMPKIGYRGDKRTRDMLPCGFWSFPVENVRDVDLLLMHNRKYAAEIGGSVSAKKRKEIEQRAAELNIKVLNKGARVKAEEAE